jgi:hypothetical protein
MATVEQLRRRDAATSAAADGDHIWRPLEFGNWDTVAYVWKATRRVTPARSSARRRRRSLNGPVTVRYVQPR